MNEIEIESVEIVCSGAQVCAENAVTTGGEFLISVKIK